MILLPTRSVTIDIPAALDDDAADAADSWSTVVSGAPAHISGAAGAPVGNGGEQIDATLLIGSEVAVVRSCRVTDDVTGERWHVLWADRKVGLGLDHTKCGLRRIHGAA